MLCVFHVSSSMVYYSTRNVTLNSVSSGKANFGFAPNAVDILGCTHYVMSVYDVQRNCFKMQSRNHLITLFCFDICRWGVFFFSSSVLSSALSSIALYWLAVTMLAGFLTFTRSMKLLNEAWGSLNPKSQLDTDLCGSRAVSWSLAADFGSYFHTKWFEQVDFNRLCWNERRKTGVRRITLAHALPLMCNVTMKKNNNSSKAPWYTEYWEKWALSYTSNIFINKSFDIRYIGMFEPQRTTLWIVKSSNLKNLELFFNLMVFGS